jgi:hypothetical protein
LNHHQHAGPVAGADPAGVPDAKGLAQRMAALRIWAREKGYYSVPFWEQALRCIELLAAPALAFILLAQGGVAAALGALVLGLHYPRAAYLGHDVAHGQWGPRGETKARIMLRLIGCKHESGIFVWQPHRTAPAARTGFLVMAAVFELDGALARFPIARNRAIDKKSRQLNKLERILIEKVYQLFRNSL